MVSFHGALGTNSWFLAVISLVIHALTVVTLNGPGTPLEDASEPRLSVDVEVAFL